MRIEPRDSPSLTKGALEYRTVQHKHNALFETATVIVTSTIPPLRSLVSALIGKSSQEHSLMAIMDQSANIRPFQSHRRSTPTPSKPLLLAWDVYHWGTLPYPCNLRYIQLPVVRVFSCHGGGTKEKERKKIRARDACYRIGKGKSIL